ncbi:MAG: hypothetical protein ACLRZH_02620 [Ruthenibacterium lactatiformans]
MLVEGNVIDGTGPLSVGNTLTIAATNGDVSGHAGRYRVQDRGHRAHQLFLGDRKAPPSATAPSPENVRGRSFSQEAYSEIFATVAGAQALDSASDEYQAAVGAVADRVEGGRRARCTARYNEVKTDTEQKLAGARQGSWKALRQRLRKSWAMQKSSWTKGGSGLRWPKRSWTRENQIASGEKELQANKESLPGTLTQKQQELAAGQAALIGASADRGKRGPAERQKARAGRREGPACRGQTACGNTGAHCCRGEARLPELAARCPHCGRPQPQPRKRMAPQRRRRTSPAKQPPMRQRSPGKHSQSERERRRHRWTRA